jgi:hypothetical protein
MIKPRRIPEGTLVDTEVAALALGITPGGVRILAFRGLLTPYGTERRRQYDLAEIMARKPLEETEES